MIAEVRDMRTIAPLFAGRNETMVRSTLDGCMGRAWANEARSAAQIVNGDFAFLAGDPTAEGAAELAVHVPQGFAGDSLLIACKTPDWYALLDANEHAKPFERYAIRKEPDIFDRERLAALAKTLPEGVTLHAIDAELYRKALQAEWSCDFVSQFADEADWLKRGLGVMALLNGEPIAGASSYVVFRGGVEIEIDTVEAHRRKGLATACGAWLMLRCLEHGLYPSWDAANRASVALAEKLGYHFDHAYRTYEYPIQGRTA